MVTQYNVEEKVRDYVTANHRKPKYVLMDSKTYKAFSKSFTPREKITYPNSSEFMIERSEEPTQIDLAWIYVSSYELKILSVNSNETIFEIVG